jgi:hypothetical protein
MNESTLFAHSAQDIAATVAAVSEFKDQRAGLFCKVAQPVKPEDGIDTRTEREVLFDNTGVRETEQARICAMFGITGGLPPAI